MSVFLFALILIRWLDSGVPHPVNPRLTLIVASSLAVIAVVTRLTFLSHPTEKVFDEVYFPVFAHNYLAGTEFFDVHPPLGKLIIAAGIASVGDSTFGWRIMPALAGLGLVAVMSAFIYDTTRNVASTLLVAALVIFDPMALVESRIGLINIFLAFFSVLGLWQFWRWWQNPKRVFSLAIAALSFAAAGSVKWIGFGTLGAVIVYGVGSLYFNQNRRRSLRWWPLALAGGVIPVVYLATFIPDLLMRGDLDLKNAAEYLSWWHSNTLAYHANLDATHPYGSPWWSWIVSKRPLWLYFKIAANDKVLGIFEPGNIVSWTLGAVIVVWLVWRWAVHGHRPSGLTLFLLTVYAVTFFPWSVIDRVKFIYHYFVPVLMLHAITALTLGSLVRSRAGAHLAVAVAACSALFFVAYYPLFTGFGVPMTYYKIVTSIPGWI